MRIQFNITLNGIERLVLSGLKASAGDFPVAIVLFVMIYSAYSWGEELGGLNQKVGTIIAWVLGFVALVGVSEAFKKAFQYWRLAWKIYYARESGLRAGQEVLFQNWEDVTGLEYVAEKHEVGETSQVKRLSKHTIERMA